MVLKVLTGKFAGKLAIAFIDYIFLDIYFGRK